MTTKAEKLMRELIEDFLKSFPNDASCWSKATEEIRDLSRCSRECLEEYEDIVVEPVNFKAIKSPAEWNTKGKESILANFDKMQPKTKQAFFFQYAEWFFGYNEQ